MLKKLIILLTVFAIENSINCAEAQNANGINYITKITTEDLAQIAHTDVCEICLQALFTDTSNLYKSNCPQMLIHPHIFHRNCILGWIVSNHLFAQNCPACYEEMLDLNTILMVATRYKHLVMVRLLLDRGADINTISFLGETALMLASSNGNLEIARLLLDRGADINARNNYKDTPLIQASEHGHLEIAKLLLDKGADVNARNDFGSTSLMFARENGHQIIADLLIARGAIE